MTVAYHYYRSEEPKNPLEDVLANMYQILQSKNIVVEKLKTNRQIQIQHEIKS